MNNLALTTRQIKFGVLIQHEGGFSFFPAWLVALYCLAFMAAVIANLMIGTIQAAGFLADLVAANVDYHAAILALGFVTIWQVTRYYAFRN